jgi:hypothetical protein
MRRRNVRPSATDEVKRTIVTATCATMRTFLVRA